MIRAPVQQSIHLSYFLSIYLFITLFWHFCLNLLIFFTDLKNYYCTFRRTGLFVNKFDFCDFYTCCLSF